MSAIKKLFRSCLMVGGLWCAIESDAWSQDFNFNTLTGNAGYGSIDGPTNEARFDFPQGVAADASGNIYVADTQNSTVRRIDPAGLVSTVVGIAGNAGSADGNNLVARFAFPRGIATDNAGNVYVADTANSTIRLINPSGVVSTLAGSPGITGSADGTNSVGRFAFPDDIVVDASGVLYVADTFNNTIRKIVPTGTNWVMTTLAGLAGVNGNSDGTNSVARFYQPSGLALDTNQNLYVADTGNGAIRKMTRLGTNWVTTTVARLSVPRRVAISGGLLYVSISADNTIRKITPTSTNGIVSLLAGSPGASGTADGTNAARFNSPSGLAVAGGVLCVADSLNNTIRKVTFSGMVSTWAGLAGGPGSVDGALAQARFNAPLGLAMDAGTNLYLTDSGNNTIRMISPAGIVTTIAGVATNLPGSIDGSGTNASFNLPASLAVDRNGNVYVADLDNNEIRKITRNGNHWTVNTLAGRAGALFYGNITNFVGVITNLIGGVTNVAGGATNITGAVTNISTAFSSIPLYFNYSGIITNISGKITNVLIVVTSSPVYTNIFKGKTNLVTLAANSFILPPYATSTIYSSSALFLNYSGTITNVSGGVTNVAIVITNSPFVTNVVNGKVQTNRLAANIFNLPPAPPLLNGTGTNALFNHPSGVALDNAGNLYVADGGTNGIRLITPGGTVTTLPASYGGYSVSPVQFGTNILFYHSSAVAVDESGTVYIADAGNNTIRKIVPGGMITTIAGAPGLYGLADGTNATARFASPVSLTVDAQTNLFVADSLSHTIRKISSVGSEWAVTTVGGLGNIPGSADGPGNLARFNYPGGIAVDTLGTLYIADTGNNTIRFGSPLVVVTAALQIASAANQVVISWPAAASAAGFVLEISTGPGLGAWVPVTNSPTIAGSQLVITIDTTLAPAAFYRLRKP